MQAALFDVDGVLVDSYEAHRLSWRALAAEEGVAFTDADFARTFGRTSRDIIAEVWPGGGPGGDAVTALDDRKEAHYRRIVRADFPAMPGAAALIDALRDAGFALAVGSSGPPPNVHLVLEALGRTEAFDAVVTGADVTRGKPDPEVYRLAADRLAAPPARCVVIEDAPAGLEAARAAGMAAVGLASTGRSPDELREADLVVSSLAELDPPRLAALLG